MAIAVPELIRPECQAIWISMAHKARVAASPFCSGHGLQEFVTAAHTIKLAMSAIAAVRATTYNVDALLGEACLFVGAVLPTSLSGCRIMNLHAGYLECRCFGHR